MTIFFSDSKVFLEKAQHHLESRLKLYGDFKYAFMILNKKNPSEMIQISNYPNEWIKIYKDNNYQHIDPVVITGFNSIAPFSWDENLSFHTGLDFSRIFNLSKNYKVINGYTFIVHDYHNNIALLSILMDKEREEEIRGIIGKYKDQLQMLLINSYDKIISLSTELCQTIDEHNAIDKEIFSPRENEVLYWASVGKTYQEIALILGITTSTVKFHIGNVVKKLGVLNAKHAIRMGIELQLIKPVQS